MTSPDLQAWINRRRKARFPLPEFDLRILAEPIRRLKRTYCAGLSIGEVQQPVDQRMAQDGLALGIQIS